MVKQLLILSTLSYWWYWWFGSQLFQFLSTYNIDDLEALYLTIFNSCIENLPSWGVYYLIIIQVLSWVDYLMVSCLFQYEKVNKFISTAKSEGATILCGGGRPQVNDILFSFMSSFYCSCPVKIESYLQHLGRGFFIEPTIIAGVNTTMQVWREEIFGPVLCVKTFKTEDEAIEIANDTQWVTCYVT